MVRHDETLIPKATTPSAAFIDASPYRARPSGPQPPRLYQVGSCWPHSVRQKGALRASILTTPFASRTPLLGKEGNIFGRECSLRFLRRLLHAFRHADGNRFGADGDSPGGGYGEFHDFFSFTLLFNPASDFQLDSKRRRFQIIHAQCSGHVSRRNGAAGDLVTGYRPAKIRGRGCCHRVAIDQRREQASVHEARKRRVVRSGREMRDDFIAFNKALQLMSVGIVASAAVTVGNVLGIKILDRRRAMCAHDSAAA